MILNERGYKRTANQLAKELVLAYGQRAYYWQEKFLITYAVAATEKEVERVRKGIDTQLARVGKHLGWPDSNKENNDE